MSDGRARRVVANISLSLDGRTTGPGGDQDMSWIVPHATTEGAREGLLRLTRATTALLGRRNWQGFQSYWPRVAADPEADPRDRAFARWLDDVEKVVLSSTLAGAEGGWRHSRIVDRPAADVVRELRAHGSGDIVVLGSQSVIRALLAADEVDRLSINLAPELVGGGSRLFDDATPQSSWTLAETQSRERGSIWLLYDRVRPGSGDASARS